MNERKLGSIPIQGYSSFDYSRGALDISPCDWQTEYTPIFSTATPTVYHHFKNAKACCSNSAPLETLKVHDILERKLTLCLQCASHVPNNSAVISLNKPTICHRFDNREICKVSAQFVVITIKQQESMHLDKCLRCVDFLADCYVDKAELPYPDRVHFYDDSPAECQVSEFVTIENVVAQELYLPYCARCMNKYIKKKQAKLGKQ